jgi:hypothetical protein
MSFNTVRQQLMRNRIGCTEMFGVHAVRFLGTGVESADCSKPTGMDQRKRLCLVSLRLCENVLKRI